MEELAALSELVGIRLPPIVSALQLKLVRLWVDGLVFRKSRQVRGTQLQLQSLDNLFCDGILERKDVDEGLVEAACPKDAPVRNAQQACRRANFGAVLLQAPFEHRFNGELLSYGERVFVGIG